jgi:threonine/homoserine/homoserine lactone efflux protein
MAAFSPRAYVLGKNSTRIRAKSVGIWAMVAMNASVEGEPMPTVPTILLFMAAALAVNVTPGPSILFILSRCLGQGRQAAVVSVFGLATASILQAAAAGCGLSTLFAYSALAFDVCKYAGAAYLIGLGIAGFMRGGIGGLVCRVDVSAQRSLLMVYWQAVVTDLLNPKLVLFFFSFLPQFVDPSRGAPAVQMLVLGLLFQVTGIPTNLAVALAGGGLARFIARHPVAARIQSWAANTILIGLGVRLAFSEPR